MTKKPAPKKKSSQADGIRGSLWYFDPAELTIVGFDTGETEHELCDAQSNAFDAEHYEEYINYMRLNGIDKPVIFRREAGTGRKLVVEGRTTVRVARVVAPLWEKDQGEPLRVPAVVRQGTADELFCTREATNRRRPGSENALRDAQAIERLMRNGATREQAATRLGIPVERAPKLLAVLQLHPKVQRQVGAALSLDAAAKLAKLPELEQVKRLDEFKAQGEKPTARAVTNKLREGSGKAPVETPLMRIKRALVFIDRWRSNPAVTGGVLLPLEELRGILDPRRPNDAAQPAAEEARFGA
ncbi:MAG TPA: hypothetical protein VFZ21_26045 [Gemmatimonadaceae bacterium]|nr:hypothetical protein [Gemmatimonadaceae bacterium]